MYKVFVGKNQVGSYDSFAEASAAAEALVQSGEQNVGVQIPAP